MLFQPFLSWTYIFALIAWITNSFMNFLIMTFEVILCNCFITAVITWIANSFRCWFHMIFKDILLYWFISTVITWIMNWLIKLLYKLFLNIFSETPFVAKYRKHPCESSRCVFLEMPLQLLYGHSDDKHKKFHLELTLMFSKNLFKSCFIFINFTWIVNFIMYGINMY